MTDVHKELRATATAVTAAIADRSYAPHCDSGILHRPGICWACDGYPDRQQAREVWGINFTGESDEDKLPCPAEIRRPIDTINRWHGNVAQTAEEADAYWTKWHNQIEQLFAQPTSRRRWRRRPR